VPIVVFQFSVARPVNPVYEKDEAKRKSLLPEVLAAVTQLLDKVEARLAANPSGWLIGNKVICFQVVGSSSSCQN